MEDVDRSIKQLESLVRHHERQIRVHQHHRKELKRDISELKKKRRSNDYVKRVS